MNEMFLFGQMHDISDLCPKYGRQPTELTLLNDWQSVQIPSICSSTCLSFFKDNHKGCLLRHDSFFKLFLKYVRYIHNLNTTPTVSKCHIKIWVSSCRWFSWRMFFALRVVSPIAPCKVRTKSFLVRYFKGIWTNFSKEPPQIIHLYWWATMLPDYSQKSSTFINNKEECIYLQYHTSRF